MIPQSVRRSAMKPLLAVSQLALSLLLLSTHSVHSSRFEVVENTEAGEIIGQLHFAESEITVYPCPDLLIIEGTTLKTKKKFDREEILTLNETRNDILYCRANLQGSIETIEIMVLDVNDNVPHFSELDPVHVLNITENFNIPNSILRLEPFDPDNGSNGTADFYIISGNEEDFFYIGPPLDGPHTRDELFFNRSADYETHKTFNLTIFMHDNGTPQLNFTQIIVIDVNDVNDECPTFIMTEFDFDLNENQTVGPEHPFAQAAAIDRDSIPSIMEFTFRDEVPRPPNAFEYIAINNKTGQLYLKQAIDYETDVLLHQIEFSIQVQERGMVAKVGVATVKINLIDFNEDGPEIHLFLHTQYVQENQNQNVQFLVIQVSDTNGFEDPIVEVNPPLPVIITKLGILYSISINGTIDREVVDHVTFNITVHDKGSPSLATTFSADLTVLDENDNPPSFTEDEYTTLVMESTPIGHRAAVVHAIDPDVGENAVVSYAIESVTPSVAEPWFSIDPVSGNITVDAHLNYTLASSVRIRVAAKDNGTTKAYTKNSTATVHISISPSVTFKPWSYQEHCLPNAIKIQDSSTKIYLEFRTGEKNGLLLYDQSGDGEHFVIRITEGKIVAVAQNLVQSMFDGFNVSTNKWIAVRYDFEKKTLDVSYADQGQNSRPLTTYERVGCDDMNQVLQTFYLGGIDAFSQFENASDYSNFIGTIRNVVIGSVLVDLASPLREENVIRGVLFPSEPKCGAAEMTCSEPYHSGCLDYDFESHCICSGGFNSDACAKKENYDPIQLSSSSTVKVSVNYALFVDLLQRSRLVNPSTIPVTENSGRRRRRHLTPHTSDYQLVEFKFRLLRESNGTLLYSKTRTSIHNLEITTSYLESPPQHSIRYTIADANIPSQIVHVHIAKRFNFILGDLYTISVNMTTTHVHISFNGSESTVDWDNVAPFIEYPHTEISIGGTESSRISSNFNGCVAELSVNGIQFPLNGLVEHNDASIQIVRGSGSSGVSTTCDLCQQERNPCSSPFECFSNSHNYTCDCPNGLRLNDKGDQCIEPPTNQPSGVIPPASKSTFSLYYIAAGGAGVILCAALILTIVCCVCYRRRKQKNQKQRYHVGGDQQLPTLGSGSHQRSRANSYSEVQRGPSMCNSETAYGMMSRQNHDGSSSTTCNDEDTESNLQHMIRSKSSTSGETGFHTASERDDQRSLPRMDDSGNEKDTDYSTPFESESDDSQSYVEMETPVPINLHRGNSKGRADLNMHHFSSTSPSLGPVSSIGDPLTSKEKKFITPLRPNSRSELGEETDLDTDFSSTVLPGRSMAFSRNGYRGGSLKLPGRPESGLSGRQWYKSSTSSDTERERKRADANRAYYPPNPYQSLRRTRATSASSAQQAVATELISPLPKCSSLTPPLLQGSSRIKRDPHAITPPISPLTSFAHHHHHQQRSTPPHLHQKTRESPKASDGSELSTAGALSRPQPLKMHYPFLRQSSESPRVPVHLTTRHYAPSYMRSFSEESSQKEKKFVDLGSVRTHCDPIQYWEGQARMMPTVDHQVDAYPVLSESFTPYEDSTVESQQSGPQHLSFASEGGGEGTAEALDVGLLHDCDAESVATGTTLKGSENESRVILFPSADCSDEYRCTPRMMACAASQSDSNLLQYSGSVPPSQGAFEV